MKKINSIFLFSIVVFLFAFLYGCKDNITDPQDIATDYSNPARWLSVPDTVHNVDVFYMYPTSCEVNTNPNNPQVCAIDDPVMLRDSRLAFDRQATAFENTCNVFAPFYRQVNTYNTTLMTPTYDAIAAFDYYIKHFNNGRPFILAGHSQGGNVLHNLLSDYLKYNTQVYSRMIAAYIIGFPITQQYLSQNPHLKFATGPDDTGVIISYNTQSSDVSSPNPILFNSIGIVINPVNWLRDETYASISQGLGSILPDSTGKFVPVPQCADAKIDIAKGVLVANVPLPLKELIFKLDSLEGFPRGVYHSFDYPFYYFNIRENAANRIQHYFNKN